MSIRSILRKSFSLCTALSLQAYKTVGTPSRHFQAISGACLFQKPRRIMNSKHLATGETCPALIPGSLRIYSMRVCPYAQRALLVAAAKGIKYDVVNINLINKPEFIFPKNSGGKVPTIETDDGRCLYESLIVSDYMDEAPEYNKVAVGSGGDAVVRVLNSKDPFQKALDRIWIERLNKLISLDFQLFCDPNLSGVDVESRIKLLHDELRDWDEELGRRSTKFFGGSEKPGMLDYMIWPWFERLPSLEQINIKESSILKTARTSQSNLVKWEQLMIQDDAVQASYLTPEMHTKYRMMKRSNGPYDYDYLLKEN